MFLLSVNPEEIINYWYSGRIKKHWFSSTTKIDNEIKDNYQSLWQQAKEGTFDEWKKSPEGCLALCIVLDQFPLNMFRGEAMSFETESKAIEVALHAINSGYDKKLKNDQLSFLFMPLMHSEKLEDQELSVTLFEKYNLTNNLRFARHHRDIIKKFGRFPHRNKILGRKSTVEEIQYLESKHAFKG